MSGGEAPPVKLFAASTALLLVIACPRLAAAEPESQPDAALTAEQEAELLARLDRYQRDLRAELSRDLEQRLARQSELALVTAFERRIERVASTPTPPASIASRRGAHQVPGTDAATPGRMRCTRAVGQPLECRVLAEDP